MINKCAVCRKDVALSDQRTFYVETSDGSEFWFCSRWHMLFVFMDEPSKLEVAQVQTQQPEGEDDDSDA